MKKILLVGDDHAQRMREHLAPYADGEIMVTSVSHFHAVPQGTEWVIIADSHGPLTNHITVAGEKAHARVVFVPGASWAQTEKILRRNGFFTNGASGSGGLTQQPFAGLTAALAAKKQHEREEAARKSAAATERGLHPPPLPPQEPEPEPAPTPPPEPPGKAPVAATLLPAPMAKKYAAPVATSPLGIKKEAQLRQIFEWNPDLAILDAQMMLTSASVDGRAISRDRAGAIRSEVRRARGLEPFVRRRCRVVGRVNPSYPTAPLKREEPEMAAEPPKAAPPQKPQQPALPPMAPPKVISDAADLLADELRKATGVDSFSLTYQKGERVVIRWRPNIEELSYTY